MIGHIHYVGPGILAKMQELDDEPATCEKYPFLTRLGDKDELIPDEYAGEVSLAWGKSGMLYVYLKSLDRTIVNATLDMLIAGGTV